MPLVKSVTAGGTQNSTKTRPPEFDITLPSDFCDETDKIIYPAVMAIQQNCADKADCLFFGCETQRNGITIDRSFTSIADENQCLGNQRRAITDYDLMVKISLSKVMSSDVLSLMFPGIWSKQGEYNRLTFTDPSGGNLPTYRILVEDASGGSTFKWMFFNAELDPDTAVSLQMNKTLSEVTLSFRALDSGLGRGYVETLGNGKTV